MSTSIPSHILIFGATGSIGRYITDAIVKAKPAFPKVTIFTSSNTAESEKSTLLDDWKTFGATVITGDITNSDDITAAYEGVDTVVSAVGRGVLNQQTELVRLAEASSSVKWFFPSEYGTDIEHNARSAEERTHQVKLGIRKYIREHAKSLKATYVVVGPYFEMWVDGGEPASKIGRFNIKEHTATIVGDGEGKIGFTTMGDTAKAVVGALRHPDASFDKALKIHSFVVTPNQVLVELEKQLGKQFTKEYVPISKLESIETAWWKEGNPLATIATLRRIWATGGTLYDKWDNESVGLDESNLDSLETAVKEFISHHG